MRSDVSESVKPKCKKSELRLRKPTSFASVELEGTLNSLPNKVMG